MTFDEEAHRQIFIQSLGNLKVPPSAKAHAEMAKLLLVIERATIVPIEGARPAHLKEVKND